MTGPLGPILHLQGADEALSLSAIVVAPADQPPPPLVAEGGAVDFDAVDRIGELAIWRAAFTAPLDCAWSYEALGERYDVAGGWHGDLRFAFASCNGEEHGDLEREGSERNAMWARLVDHHRAKPFHLLIHGGDQVYADEATDGHDLSDGWPDRLPKDPGRADLADLREHLRRGFFERYLAHMRSPEYAWLSARVPSVAQWDDHDICDGWGSLRRSATYSPVGQALFGVAHEMALPFQHGVAKGALTPRFEDAAATHLGWTIDLPGLRLLAPDLRSERTRRQVMGEGGWRLMQAAAQGAQPDRTFLLSSVPLLGPRLSILEALMVAVPSMQNYEDDLRDQWQSRAHRAEWRRMLTHLSDMAQSPGAHVTALSGEIHLATRAEMALESGVLHQLVASGVAHRPPPRAWARALGALSWLGEDPIPERPVKIRRIPGQSGRYVAERNTLILTREEGAWAAAWDFEFSGVSPKLPLD